MGIRYHKDLEVYQIAMDFVFQIYEITDKFPQKEQYVLTSQLRRAAISVPSNIAEGATRKNTKEFIQFLYYALGSCAELEKPNLRYPTDWSILKNQIRLSKL